MEKTTGLFKVFITQKSTLNDIYILYAYTDAQFV